jgi:hypothetical protein
MRVQFTVARETFANLIRQQLYAYLICVANEVVIPKGRAAIIDKVTLGATEIRRADAAATVYLPTDDPTSELMGGLESVDLEKASTVEIAQTLIASIATRADLAALNGNPAKTFAFLPKVTLLLGFAITLPPFKPRVPCVSISYRGLELTGVESVIGADEAANLRKTVEALIPTTCKPFPLASLTALLGETFELSNAGAVYDPALDVVAMRFETREAPRFATAIRNSWQRFYSGAAHDGLDPRPTVLASKDWSLFIDSGLVLRYARAQVDAAIKLSEDQGRFSLSSGPDLAWSNPEDAPRVIATFDVEVIDACVCGSWPLSWQVDVDVSVTATIDITVPKSNTLQTTIGFEWSSSFWELLCCHLSAAMSWITVGKHFVNSDDVSWNQYLLGIELGPIATFIGSLYTASTIDISKFGIDTSKMTGKCVEHGSDNQIVCEQDVVYPPDALLGSLTAAGASGLRNRLLLFGSVVVPETSPATLAVSDLSPFVWDWDDQCARTGLIARSAFTLLNTGSAPFQVCVIVEEGVDPGQFTPFRKVTGAPKWVGVEYAIPLDELSPEYIANPTPLVVRVHTNGGARILTIPPIPLLTEGELAAFKGVAKVRPDFCYSEEDDPFLRGFKWSSSWRPGPGPSPGTDDGLVGRLWQVLVGGIDVGDEVEIRDGSGALLAIGIGDPRGATQLSLMLPIGTESETLTLQRMNVPTTAGAVARQRWLGETTPFMIAQTQVYLCSEVAAGSATDALAMLRRGGSPNLVVALDHSVQMHDLSIPERPVCFAEVAAEGVRGFVVSPKRTRRLGR